MPRNTSQSVRYRSLVRASAAYLDLPSRPAEAYRILDQLDLTEAERKRWERAVRRSVRERFDRRIRRSVGL